MNQEIFSSNTTTLSSLDRYYTFHSRIYDLTRWSFLFGRDSLVKSTASYIKPKQILEVGCGTGTNLVQLAKLYPEAKIHGVDLSAPMLKIASKRTTPYTKQVELHNGIYNSIFSKSIGISFDLILFSYSLSMMDTSWQKTLKTAQSNLSPKGIIAVVDFFDSPVPTFKNWMQMNHVKMGPHLVKGLQNKFQTKIKFHNPAYAGLWNYFTFIGEKKN